MAIVGPLVYRRARPGDAEGIARVYVESWQSTYAGLLPDDVLLSMDAERRESRWWRRSLTRAPHRHFIQVAEHRDAGIIGFASGGPARDRRIDHAGEIYTLYLLDDWHGIGIGKRLFIETAARLEPVHGASLAVWVLAGNPNRFFYEALGGKMIARRPGRLGDETIEEVAYGWESIQSLLALDPTRRPPA